MRKKKPRGQFFKKLNKRRLVISITVIIILGIFIYNIPAIYDFFAYSDFQEASGLIGGDYIPERYGNEMLCYNNKEMVLIDTGGEAKWRVAASTTSPRVYIEDDYILLADLSGKVAYLYDENELMATIKTKDEIYGAAVDEDGNIALATKTQGYKGTVTVYDEYGEKKYVFSSGSGYISALDIRDEYLALSQIQVDKTAVNSRVILVDWEESEEKQGENQKDSMIFDIKFQAGGEIVALSDKGMIGYDDDFEKEFYVDFSGREIKKYCLESDDNMVFCFEGDRNNTIIESYSKSGKLRGTRQEDGEISNIDAEGEGILVNNMREVFKLDPDGEVENQAVSNHDVQRIKMFASRRFAIVTGNSEATIIKIN